MTSANTMPGPLLTKRCGESTRSIYRRASGAATARYARGSEMLQDTKELQELIAATDRQLGRIEKMYEYHDRRCVECKGEVPSGATICTECLTKLMAFEPKRKGSQYGDCPF